MTLDEYQKRSDDFNWESPVKGVLWFYTIGLAGEVGEVSEKVKKHYRDGAALDRAAVTKELGDVLWYLAAIANVLGIKLSEVAAANIEKLESRSARGKLPGSGDDR